MEQIGGEHSSFPDEATPSNFLTKDYNKLLSSVDSIKASRDELSIFDIRSPLEN